MIGSVARNPWTLGAAFLGSALLGAGLFALVQMALPGGRDRAQMEWVVRNYLLENPEILVEVSERLQARQAAKAETDARKALAKEGGGVTQSFAGAWAGNPQGDVTVVAFLDYNCGYCRASLPAIAELVRRDAKVRVVYREYPVLGEESVLAARWALAAAEQGKFKPFHEALYAAGRANQASIAAAAAVAGLDTGRAAQALESRAITGELDANHAIGQRLGMSGTPAWVVGKRVIHGAQEYAQLAEAVADARAGK